MTSALQSFIQSLQATLPAEQIISDTLRRHALAHDASFYSLIPQLIVVVRNDNDVIAVLNAARRYHIAITFRASGTSLSGQSISDSVLVRLSDDWRQIHLAQKGEWISTQPNVLGGVANAKLAPYRRSLAAQPASIAAASVGGMAINNASGMNSLDSYHHVKSLRIIFADGRVLDTGDDHSKREFSRHSADFIARLLAIKKQIDENPSLQQKIRAKYRIKNTMGLQLKAFVDYDDPFDIIQGLMFGSEGTLAFLSHLTQKTVVIKPYSRSALLLFRDLHSAADCVMHCRQHAFNISAAELLDTHALRAIASTQNAQDALPHIGDNATALLIQIDGESTAQLHRDIEQLRAAIAPENLMTPFYFSDDAEQIARWWNIRKGVLPAVGAQRVVGSTALIEDVCYPLDQLAPALTALRQLLNRFHYHDAVIFGHAMAGNVHFVFSQSFETESERQRYHDFMNALAAHVVSDFNGSLKAEHGTGRNMAPFVRFEWGDDAYAIMRAVKQLFDPDNILNPGVIFNDDPLVHLKNIKRMKPVQFDIDPCIECGFCERVCPSQNITFTPRQRIVARRALPPLVHQSSPQALATTFDYFVDATCAGCGLCETVCPINVNTGRMVREWRAQQAHEKRWITWIHRHFSLTTHIIRLALSLHRLLPKRLRHPLLPPPSRHPRVVHVQSEWPAVVYLPSCSSRVLGYEGKKNLAETTIAVLERSGYRVIIPAQSSSLCCGMAFNSNGYPDLATQQQQHTLDALNTITQNGKIPVYMDNSACCDFLRQTAQTEGFTVYDSVEFIAKYVLDKLTLTPKKDPIALHITCSTRRQKHHALLQHIAQRCAVSVVEPEGIQCCGFAGSKGFTTPELNASALATLKNDVSGCCSGYSSSRTCELGLSHHSAIDYSHIIFLVDECSQKKQGEA